MHIMHVNAGSISTMHKLPCSPLRIRNPKNKSAHLNRLFIFIPNSIRCAFSFHNFQNVLTFHVNFPFFINIGGPSEICIN